MTLADDAAEATLDVSNAIDGKCVTGFGTLTTGDMAIYALCTPATGLDLVAPRAV